MNYSAYTASKAGETLQLSSVPEVALLSHEVRLKVSHCGICHSDLHLIDDDWRMSVYPLIPGHEVVGTITEIGDEVKLLKVGDVVGVGWQAGACLECEWCISGQENLCKSSSATCVGRNGGFGEQLVVDNRFAFVIPPKLKPENAAPLMCGGITVYSPLKNYEVQNHHKTGVVGIGGLGHLALQFLSALGCEVTAFSTSMTKKPESQKLGATHFVNTREEGWSDKNRESLDFILVTATAQLDWAEYINVLRPNGKLIFVTGVGGNLDISTSSLLLSQKVVGGSVIGGRKIMQEMLEFAARHQISAMTEVVPMSEVNTALEKVRANEVRYRMVLKNEK